MVTDQAIDVPETTEDQVPAEPQLEAPEVNLEAPTEPAEEAAPAEEPEKPLTRAEFEALLREREETVRKEAVAEARERERRERQRENARREQDRVRRESEDAEANELLSAQLVRLGLPDADPQHIKPILDRYAQKREQQVTGRTLAEVSDAITAASADVLGVDYDQDLSPAADQYRQRLQPFVQDMYERAKEAVAKSGDYIPKSDLPKLVEAEIEKRNAKSREGKTQLARVEGTTTPADTSSVADRLDRIGTPRETREDRAWWNEREKARGR